MIEGESEGTGTDNDLAPPAGPDQAETGNDDELVPDQYKDVPNDSKTVPAPPEGRRAAARRRSNELGESLKQLGAKVGKIDTLESTVEELRRVNGQMMQALQQRQQESAQQQQQTQQVDDPVAAKLQFEANQHMQAAQEAMSKGDYAGWQKSFMAAAKAEAKAIAREESAGARQPVGPSLPPEIVALQGEFHRVLSHPAGTQVLRAEDAMLPPHLQGYDRVRKAYENANARLFGKAGGTQQRQQTRSDAQARGHFTAPRAAESSEGAGGGVELPAGMTMAQVKEVAAKAKMSVERYLHWALKQEKTRAGG